MVWHLEINARRLTPMIAALAIVALLPSVVFAKRGEFVKIEPEAEPDNSTAISATPDGISERQVTYEEVASKAEDNRKRAEESIRATKERIFGKPQVVDTAREQAASAGRREFVPIKYCDICKSALNADGTCLNARHHPRCRICNSELNADRTCPNVLSHPARPPVIPVLASLLIAVLIVWLSRRGDSVRVPLEWEPQSDWRTPQGNPDILYGPPLAATAGGNGGFSEICRARRKVEGRLDRMTYMLKYPRHDAPKSIRDAVIFEASALDFLEKHGFANAPVCRGLGQILDYSNQVPWYLMSCAPGRSLYDLMEEWVGKRFDWKVQGRLLKRLCEALVALHKLGVSHRDIKPRNIFWDGERVTLIDFGSARVPGIANPCEFDIPGTDRWEAPEQAAGRPVGPMADIYSFGLILCSVVLTRPFLDRTGSIQARYGAEFTRCAGERIAHILFGTALAESPEARAGALSDLNDAL